MPLVRLFYETLVENFTLNVAIDPEFEKNSEKNGGISNCFQPIVEQASDGG